MHDSVCDMKLCALRSTSCILHSAFHHFLIIVFSTCSKHVCTTKKFPWCHMFMGQWLLWKEGEAGKILKLFFFLFFLFSFCSCFQLIPDINCPGGLHVAVLLLLQCMRGRKERKAPITYNILYTSKGKKSCVLPL